MNFGLLSLVAELSRFAEIASANSSCFFYCMDVVVSAPVGSASSIPNDSLHEHKSGTLNSACQVCVENPSTSALRDSRVEKCLTSLHLLLQACSAGKRKCDGMVAVCFLFKDEPISRRFLGVVEL